MSRGGRPAAEGLRGLSAGITVVWGDAQVAVFGPRHMSRSRSAVVPTTSGRGLVPCSWERAVLEWRWILRRAHSSMAEQRTHNPLVGGSNPPGPTRRPSGGQFWVRRDTPAGARARGGRAPAAGIPRGERPAAYRAYRRCAGPRFLRRFLLDMLLTGRYNHVRVGHRSLCPRYVDDGWQSRPATAQQGDQEWLGRACKR